MQNFLVKKIAIAATAGVFSIASLSAHAVTVFDPSNFVKNTITSLQSVKMVAEQVKSYALDVQRFKNELEQAARFDPNSLVFRDANEDLRNSLRLIKELDGVYGSIENAKSVMEMEMRNYSMTRHTSFDDYLMAERSRVDKEGKGRIAAIQTERMAIENAQKQMSQVQEIAQQIKGPIGIQQSLQTTNQQLNLMAAQNAQLMQVIASKQAMDNQKSAMEAERDRSIAESTEKGKKMMDSTATSISNWKNN